MCSGSLNRAFTATGVSQRSRRRVNSAGHDHLTGIWAGFAPTPAELSRVNASPLLAGFAAVTSFNLRPTRGATHRGWNHDCKAVFQFTPPTREATRIATGSATIQSTAW